jgi:hypothetical protein
MWIDGAFEQTDDSFIRIAAAANAPASPQVKIRTHAQPKKPPNGAAVSIQVSKNDD